MVYTVTITWPDSMRYEFDTEEPALDQYMRLLDKCEIVNFSIKLKDYDKPNQNNP